MNSVDQAKPTRRRRHPDARLLKLAIAYFEAEQAHLRSIDVTDDAQRLRSLRGGEAAYAAAKVRRLKAYEIAEKAAARVLRTPATTLAGYRAKAKVADECLADGEAYRRLLSEVLAWAEAQGPEQIN